MPREFQLHGYGGVSPHADGLFLDPEILPVFRTAVLLRVGWVFLFEIQILLIEAENREAPGDFLVVPCSNAGKRRLTGADDVPAGRDQMHDVAKRRLGQDAVRIVGKQWLAGRRQFAGDGPVIAPLLALRWKSKTTIAPHEVFEQFRR